MNRFLTATLVATILLTPLSTVVSAQTAFPDVDDNYIYADAIEYVKNEGIVSGFSDNTFKPEQTITRAEFTKIMVNSIYDDFQKQLCEGEYYLIAGGEVYVFPDVALDSRISVDGDPLDGEYMFGDAASKFWREICVAKNNDLIGGYTDGNFYPENPITVGEASKIISNAYGFTNVDSGPEGEVFRPFIEALLGRNALPKYATMQEGNATYLLNDLNRELPRGSMAEIIYRLENDIQDKDSYDIYEQLVTSTVESVYFKGRIENAQTSFFDASKEGLYFSTCELVDDINCTYYFISTENIEEGNYSSATTNESTKIGKEFSLNSVNLVKMENTEYEVFEIIDGSGSAEPLFNL